MEKIISSTLEIFVLNCYIIQLPVVDTDFQRAIFFAYKYTGAHPGYILGLLNQFLVGLLIATTPVYLPEPFYTEELRQVEYLEAYKYQTLVLVLVENLEHFKEIHLEIHLPTQWIEDQVSLNLHFHLEQMAYLSFGSHLLFRR